MFNTAYIGLFDRTLLHMSLNQVELALNEMQLVSHAHLYPCINSTLFEKYMIYVNSEGERKRAVATNNIK